MRHYEHLAEELTALMLQHHLTAAELSRRTGIDLSTLCRIRSGRCDSLSTRILWALSHEFQIPIAELIDRFST